ncbi:MAG TPA: hypothetical protein DEO82_02595 [Eubacterium sp.]|nr:hypothetical protein [Eubacterium sp.]
MKPSKMPVRILNRSVLNNIHGKDYIGQGHGQGGVICDDICVSTVSMRYKTDFLETDLCRCINNLTAAGADCVGLTVNIMFPRTFVESRLKNLVKRIDTFCIKHGLRYMGGNTEVSADVKDIVVSVTAVGHVRRKFSKASPKEYIIVAGDVGRMGLHVLGRTYEEELSKRYNSLFMERLRVDKDGFLLSDILDITKDSKVTCMQDLTSMGVFGGLYELSERTGLGIEVDIDEIPIRQETIEVCEYFKINPYEVDSLGAMLIISPEYEDIVSKLKNSGMMASVIGRLTDKKDRVAIYKGEKRNLNELSCDALAEILYR